MYKHIKEYKEFTDIDPFDEEEWNEIEPDGTFYSWLKINYPDENKWSEITKIDCTKNNLTTLEGIENLKNLNILYSWDNNLTSLKGIEKLENLKGLYCSFNNLISLEEIENLRNLTVIFCSDNNLNSIKEIKNLNNLEILSCWNNKFSLEESKWLIKYCKENNIILVL